MKNVGKKAVRNCNLTAVKRGENAEFVGANALNGASFAGLRSVGFAILNGGGGCPLDKVKLKDNCKFCLQSELFNSSQELSHHQTATRWQSRTHEAVCEADGSKTLNDAASELRNTAFNSVSAGKFGFDNFANAVGERAAELVARFMAQTALNPQKASWRQLNARLNNFAEFAAARRAAEFDTRYGDGWQNGEADGSKTLNDAASELRNTAFNSVSAGKFGFDNFANAGEVSGEVGRTFSSPQNSNLTFKTNATDLVAYKNLLLEKTSQL